MKSLFKITAALALLLSGSGCDSSSSSAKSRPPEPKAAVLPPGHWVLVHDHNRPLPGQPPEGWYFNSCGGDCGTIGDIGDPLGGGVARYSMSTPGVWRAECGRSSGGMWEFMGFWYSISRNNSQHHQFPPGAILHPLIRREFQGKITGIEVVVPRIELSESSYSAALAVELKGRGKDGRRIAPLFARVEGRSELLAGPFPKTFFFPLDPASADNFQVGELVVLLDRVHPGDAFELDRVRLRVELPATDPRLEPFLWVLSMLLDNFDPVTGMAQDRSYFSDGDFENLTVTAKLAKLLAGAIRLELVDEAGAMAAIDKIATALLTVVPRGPAGLWPHFTAKGGSVPAKDSEWASGETAFALLDLMTALQMTGDPNGRLPECQRFLETIDWRQLRRPGHGYSHGFLQDGTPLEATWVGFGVESLALGVAALAGGADPGEMLAPPSDDGAGFVLHAGYPLPPLAIDRWGNDWSALRRAETRSQIGWYADPAHANPFLVSRGLFGLSAAEKTVGWHPNPKEIYQAFGIGGRLAPPVDGGHKVVTPHYSGMIAELEPQASLAMWRSLKEMGLVSPMNMVESLAVDPATGVVEQGNLLRGSFNLAQFAEGWMFAQPGVRDEVQRAVAGIPSLARAWAVLFPVTAVSGR